MIRLTRRENDIARLLVQTDWTQSEIADRLCIANKTVQSHVLNIAGKLGVRGERATAVQLMYRGLVKDA